MDYEQVPIDGLRLHPDAARVPQPDSGDLATLRESLEEHGQQDPIDVTADGTILDGRTRWTLLGRMGHLTVKARVVDVPEGQQTHYIVDRALSRRHLTADQKRALNGLLRTVVVETVDHPATGEEVRVGLSQTQRAQKLGVTKETVNEWDRAERSIGIPIDQPDAPTHIRREPNVQKPEGDLYPIQRATPETGRKPPTSRPPAAQPRHPKPLWWRQFSLWVHRPLPEHRRHLLEMDREVHKALALIGAEEEQSDG